MRRNKPKLITAEKLKEIILNTSFPVKVQRYGNLRSYMRHQSLVYEWQAFYPTIVKILVDPTLHISAHQSAADRYCAFLREKGVRTRRWVIYREESPDFKCASRVGLSDVNDFTIDVSEHEFSVLMIALERALIHSKRCWRHAPERDALAGEESAFESLFHRLLKLANRPPVFLDGDLTLDRKIGPN